MKTALLILACCYLLPQKNNAQNFPQFTFNYISNHNQVPNDACSNLYKDSKGFLWISTMEGLLRYDGKSTTLYNYDINNPNSIANGNVQAAAEDTDGNIWVSQSRGISCLFLNSGKIKNYFYNEADTNSILENYSMVRIDKNGNIFNTDRDGYQLKRFEKESGKFIPVKFDTLNDGFNNKGESSSLIGTLSVPQYDGSMYLISRNGIFIFDTKTFIRRRICKSSQYTPLHIFKDHSGSLWVGEWIGGLSLVDEKTKTKRNIIPNVKIGSIAEFRDNSGKYWILASDSKTGSIVIVDPLTKKYQFQLLKIQDEIAVNIVPRTIYCDTNSSVYVTSATGLLLSNAIGQCIKNIYTYERGKAADISFDNQVCAGLQFFNGDYAFGMFRYNGLRIYDSNLVLKKTIKTYKYGGKTYDLDVRSITTIVPGEYIIGGETGIALMKNDMIVPLVYEPKNKSNNHSVYGEVRSILPINKNEYWVTMLNDGVKIFSSVSKSFTKEYIYADKAQKIPLNAVRNIIYDKSGRLWLNNYFGIYLYDKANDEFVKQPINEKAMYLSEMYSICFDESENIWIAGEEGVLRYNLQTQKERFFTSKDGLANNITSKALADDKDNIWIIHQTGISMLNTKTNSFKAFNRNDGLPFFYTQPDGTSFIDTKNNLIVGNDGVITIMAIDKIKTIKTPLPRVIITLTKSANSTVPIERGPSSEKKITLTHENFPVNILFSIIDHSINARRTYFYRYIGRDTTWKECSNGFVPITTTEPGKYTIEVTGMVNNIHAENIDSITFSILPKWYQTVLFKLTCLLLGGLGIYSFIKWRIRAGKSATELKQLIIETEMAALKAQMNPHFMFNCINSIDAFIQTNDKYNATLYLNKFAKLIRNVLDSSKQNVVPFSKDIETLKLYIELEELRSDNKFKTNVVISDELMNDDYKVPPLIIQPFVENAILHGLKNREDNNGLLSINIQKQNNKIYYVITDNGIGRHAASQIIQNKETHFGMQMSYDRIKLFNKETDPSVVVTDLYEGQRATGTKIEVYLNIV